MKWRVIQKEWGPAVPPPHIYQVWAFDVIKQIVDELGDQNLQFHVQSMGKTFRYSAKHETDVLEELLKYLRTGMRDDGIYVTRVIYRGVDDGQGVVHNGFTIYRESNTT